jgi:hypothetical protein
MNKDKDRRTAAERDEYDKVHNELRRLAGLDAQKYEEPTPEPPMTFAEMLAQFDRLLDKMDATKLAMANMQADLRYIKGVLT